MRPSSFTAAALGALLLTTSAGAFAGGLNSAAECVVGMRVTTSDGHKGAITRVDRDWSYCYVKQDDTGRDVGYLYSLLKPEAGGGAPAAGGGGKLAVGAYTCWVGTQASAMGLQVTGASTYASEGQSGKYHVEPSGHIVFESGPFAGFHSEILSGGRIGLNLSGGTFYNMACDPP